MLRDYAEALSELAQEPFHRLDEKLGITADEATELPGSLIMAGIAVAGLVSIGFGVKAIVDEQAKSPTPIHSKADNKSISK
jgi:hypothetical protein